MSDVKCPKCNNVMMPEVFPGLDSTQWKRLFGFQCFNCGNIIYVNWKIPEVPLEKEIISSEK